MAKYIMDYQMGASHAPGPNAAHAGIHSMSGWLSPDFTFPKAPCRSRSARGAEVGLRR
jgi:hypothetical protein